MVKDDSVAPVKIPLGGRSIMPQSINPARAGGLLRLSGWTHLGLFGARVICAPLDCDAKHTHTHKCGMKAAVPIVHRFDHIFGLYVTRSTPPRVRRLDLILVPRK